MEWTRGPVIGRGSSAIVSVATTPSGELIAVKSTELSSSSLLQKEKHLVSQLSSPYVVKYLGFDTTCENNKPMYNLLLEYVPGGALSDLIKNQGGILKECLIQPIVHQILQGLDYLHSNSVVHCDIKGQNILIAENGFKIADFGCAKLIQGDLNTKTFSGTPVFMAPEVARGEEQGFPADIWAVGCTIIEMATGSNPWPELNDPVSAIYRIGYSEDLPELPPWLSNDALDFLSKCLMRNAEQRWTAKQLLQHKFLDGLKSNLQEANEFVRNSPTSILDQAIWDSLDASEASPMSTRDASSFESPADRIIRIGSSDSPNWVDEEGWITVRCIDNGECQELSPSNSDIKQDYENLLQDESDTFLRPNSMISGHSITDTKQDYEDFFQEGYDTVLRCNFTILNDEHVLGHSITVEISSFDYFANEIGSVNSFDTEKDLMMSDESVIHVLVISTVDLESDVMEYFGCSVQKKIHLCLCCLSLFFIWSHALPLAFGW